MVGANLWSPPAAVCQHLGADAVSAYLSVRAPSSDANALLTRRTAASKAALEQCIRAWRVEHPDRRFVRVVMGNCEPTEFAGCRWATDLLEARARKAWAAQALPGGLMHVDEVGSWLARSFAVMLDTPTIDAHDLYVDARPDPA